MKRLLTEDLIQMISDVALIEKVCRVLGSRGRPAGASCHPGKTIEMPPLFWQT
jgi:hypothetical protein